MAFIAGTGCRSGAVLRGAALEGVVVSMGVFKLSHGVFWENADAMPMPCRGHSPADSSANKNADGVTSIPTMQDCREAEW